MSAPPQRMNHPFLALNMYMQARRGFRNDPRCVREVVVVALEVMKEGGGEGVGRRMGCSLDLAKFERPKTTLIL